MTQTQLISAAPDMYEALKAVGVYLSENYCQGNKPSILSQVISALAKSEGK